MESPSPATSTQDTAISTQEIAAGRMDVVLGVLRLSSSSSSMGGAGSRAAAASDIRAQAARLARAATKKLFIFINTPASGVTPQLLQDLALMFEGVASVNPRLLTVPLLPWAGWSAEKVAELDGIRGFVCPSPPSASTGAGEARAGATAAAREEAGAGAGAGAGTGTGAAAPAAAGQEAGAGAGTGASGLAQGLPGLGQAPEPGSGTASGLLPDIVQLPSVPEQRREAVLRLLATATTAAITTTTATATATNTTGATATTATAAASADTSNATSGGADSGVSSSSSPYPGCNVSGEVLCFDNVAMGGTFDRLHAGHMLLLAGAAIVATRTLFVGVTADALLAKKSHRELLQPYSEREEVAVRYLTSVRPGLQVQTGALKDPQEPTGAEINPEMQAIVVSQETIPGATAINEGRKRRGYQPLQVVVVSLIGSHGAGGAKLSSTDLRAADAVA